MMTTITLEMLKGKNACSDQVAEFAHMFPDGVTFKSEAHAVKMCRKVASVFNWDWAARNLLSPDGWKDYDAAYILWVINPADAPLWVAHHQARVKMLAKMNLADGTLLGEWYYKLPARLEKLTHGFVAESFAKAYFTEKEQQGER